MDVNYNLPHSCLHSGHNWSYPSTNIPQSINKLRDKHEISAQKVHSIVVELPVSDSADFKEKENNGSRHSKKRKVKEGRERT